MNQDKDQTIQKQEEEPQEQTAQSLVQGDSVTEAPTPSPRHHKKPLPVRNTLYKVRQILNLLFMLLGVIGAVMYSGIVGNGVIEQMGGIIVVIAISLKMAECVLRYIK